MTVPFVSKKWEFLLSFLILPLATLIAREQPLHLTYSIHPIFENEKTALEVEAEFEGSDEEITEIVLPSSWAGQEKLYQQISIRECSGKIQDTDLPEIKKIQQIPHSTIRITYVVEQEEKKGEKDWYYRPLIQKDYFFFFGHCFFVLPKTDKKEALVTLKWRELPSNWTIANSFHIRETEQELTTPLDTVLNAVFTGGNIEILSCGDNKAPIFIVGIGEPPFALNRLTQLVPPIIESQRRFWNDFDFPHFVITVLPTGNDQCTFGGTATFQAFSLFLGDLPDEEAWKIVAWVLSHEHFHAWNGTKMRSDAEEGTLYWFSEGFTEYYTNKLNFKNQLFSINDYVENINNFLYEYFVSPARNAKNEQIPCEFWTNRAIQRLPYVRGFMLALRWDKKIKKATDTKYCLDDFMWALFQKAKELEKPFPEELLKQTMCLFLPREVVDEDIRRYITDGETLNPDEADLDDLCTLEWTEDIGFNLHAAQSKGTVEGIRKGTSAEKAGLVNGQPFLRYHCADGIVSVTVIDKNGTTKEISYPQNPNAERIPLFKIRSATCLDMSQRSLLKIWSGAV